MVQLCNACVFFSKIMMERLSSLQKPLKLSLILRTPTMIRGSCYRMKGEYAKAIVEYELALKKNPNLVFVLNNIGTTKKRMKDYAGAMAAFNRALSIDDKFHLALNNRGAAQMDNGRLDDAQKDFEKCMQVKPDYAPAYLQPIRD
jgi:tetratricopeptide (TPR) repeat protein